MKRKLLIMALFFNTLLAGTAPSYFINLGLGGSVIEHPGSLKSTFELLSSSFTNTKIALDLGIYFPLSKQIIFGFDVSGVADAYANETLNSRIQMNYYLYSLSALYFPFESTDGLFLRGDVGAARGLLMTKSSISDTTTATEWGQGVLIGIGYKINIFYITLDTMLAQIENETLSAQSIKVGLLW